MLTNLRSLLLLIPEVLSVLGFGLTCALAQMFVQTPPRLSDEALFASMLAATFFARMQRACYGSFYRQPLAMWPVAVSYLLRFLTLRMLIPTAAYLAGRFLPHFTGFTSGQLSAATLGLGLFAAWLTNRTGNPVSTVRGTTLSSFEQAKQRAAVIYHPKCRHRLSNQTQPDLW